MKKNNSTYINIWPMVECLSAEETLCLICIEKTRCTCRVEGRKWISIMMELVDFKFAHSLRDAFNLLKHLYGEKWNEVEFDYYNALRGRKNKMKYLDITAEFDILLWNFANAALEKIDLFGCKDKNDKFMSENAR